MDPERALQKATDKFLGRWQGMHDLAATEGGTLATVEPSKLDEYWNKVKSSE